MKTHHQEKCEQKKKKYMVSHGFTTHPFGEPCQKCMEMERKYKESMKSGEFAPSPHTEGWEEKIDWKSQVEGSMSTAWLNSGNTKALKESTKSLIDFLEKRISFLLLSTRYADITAFRGMIPKENNGETCTEMCEKRRTNGFSCYHQTQDEITTAIRQKLQEYERRGV